MTPEQLKVREALWAAAKALDLAEDHLIESRMLDAAQAANQAAIQASAAVGRLLNIMRPVPAPTPKEKPMRVFTYAIKHIWEMPNNSVAALILTLRFSMDPVELEDLLSAKCVTIDDEVPKEPDARAVEDAFTDAYASDRDLREKLTDRVVTANCRDGE